MPKRILRGVVVSDKADKTAIVKVDRMVLHPLYKKSVRRSKRYATHDQDNRCRIGEWVVIQECRPLSKRKSWMLVNIEQRA